MSVLWLKKKFQENQEELQNESLFEENQISKKQIWAIGGGKGGVGKSLIASNLGIMLARKNKKVILVDLDLGGANLHTCLGVELPQATLSDFIDRRLDKIENLIVETPIKNLGLISGARDSFGIANLKHAQKQRFINNLLELDANYLVFDLGAGTSFNTLDFFLASDIGIITLLPEPTSIENVYRFIKSAFYRKLKIIESSMDVKNIIDKLMLEKDGRSIKTPSDLIKEISVIDPELGFRIKQKMRSFSPKIIVNMIRSQSDIELGYAVSSVCKKYFGINTDVVGYIEYDNSVWQSVRKKTPLLMEFPNSKLVSNFNKIYNKLTQPDVKFINRI